MKQIILFSSLIWGLLSLPSQADDRESLGRFRDWDAYVLNQGDQKICFAITVPTKKTPTNVNHGDVYMTVTHRPLMKISNEVNFVTAYSYKKGTEVVIRVSGKAFKMHTQAGSAWTYTTRDDNAIVTAAKKGNQLTVQAVSARGTKTNYTISLLGFTAAHKAASKACGL